jgi:hypothetical protein
MSCVSCNQREFPAEINVHFPGRKNIDRPSVLVFPKLLVCLDCGSTQFKLSETELHLLTESRTVRIQDC